jgi:hypothetical protein
MNTPEWVWTALSSDGTDLAGEPRWPLARAAGTPPTRWPTPWNLWGDDVKPRYEPTAAQHRVRASARVEPARTIPLAASLEAHAELRVVVIATLS